MWHQRKFSCHTKSVYHLQLCSTKTEEKHLQTLCQQLDGESTVASPSPDFSREETGLWALVYKLLRHFTVIGDF